LENYRYITCILQFICEINLPLAPPLEEVVNDMRQFSILCPIKAIDFFEILFSEAQVGTNIQEYLLKVIELLEWDSFKVCSSTI
jgi:hypothetical protein